MRRNLEIPSFWRIWRVMKQKKPSGRHGNAALALGVAGSLLACTVLPAGAAGLSAGAGLSPDHAQLEQSPDHQQNFPAAPVLNPAQKGWVERIEDALASTRMIQARFRQTAANGEVTNGSLILERPGRMRFTYDPPSPLLLVADDGKIVFQDKSIDQITTLPADHTPLGILLQPHPRFRGDITLTGFKQVGNELFLNVVRTSNPAEGELTLIFTAQPLTLVGWNVRDAQGHVTSVRLSDVRNGWVPLPPKTFRLPKPKQ
ncbi:LolA family protein [Oecophyllibacter saccharovorans]|uniref:LolA family protein n=1 Tax=Oecophyllibacter saccharovorans TaxID=2558360 RepID=UPI001F4F4B83|nr:outer membrane lipoprotein carrier protein LolA [Oecophyllibacter saccharovorans]